MSLWNVIGRARYRALMLQSFGAGALVDDADDIGDTEATGDFFDDLESDAVRALGTSDEDGSGADDGARSDDATNSSYDAHREYERERAYGEQGGYDVGLNFERDAG